MRSRAAAVAVGVPLALVAVVAVEAVVASGREYLPEDVGYEVEVSAVPSAVPATGSAIRMAMLGDSTVAGIGAPTVEESLLGLTAQRVADALGRPVQGWGFGVSGARTADVRDAQAPQLDGETFDVVVVVIGSNDTTHATPPWRFGELTRSMLVTTRERGGGVPVVLGGIPLFGSATALAQPLRFVVDTYARALRRTQRDVAAEVDGVTFVNIATQASPRFEGVPEAMSSDGFHPAPTGYGFWADALADGVVAALDTR